MWCYLPYGERGREGERERERETQRETSCSSGQFLLFIYDIHVQDHISFRNMLIMKDRHIISYSMFLLENKVSYQQSLDVLPGDIKKTGENQNQILKP